MASSQPRSRIVPLAVRACLPLVFALTAALTSSGCNYFVMLGYLIGGPPSIEPDFDKMTGKSMTDLDVKVAVVCYAETELRFDHHKIDAELAKYVTFGLKQHEITVISPDYIRAWMDENPDWDKPEEIGAHFEATYVIYIDLHKFRLFENGNQSMYRGRAEAHVSVIEIDEDGHGDRIYGKEVISEFPSLVGRSASSVTYTTFKRQYLTNLSETIGRLFCEHYAGDKIPDAT